MDVNTGSNWMVVAHCFNHSTSEAGESLEFEVNLVYRASSRTARVTQREILSQKTKQTNKHRRQNIGQEKKSLAPKVFHWTYKTSANQVVVKG